MTLLAGLAGAVVGVAGGPLLLRAACRSPGVRHSRARAAVVALVTGVVFGSLAARLAGDPHGRYALPAFVALAALGVTLAVVDLDTHRLPDRITLPAYPALLVLLAGASWWSGDWPALARAGLACLVALLLYAVLSLAAPQGLGFGDVKLAGLLASPLGWLSWPSAVTGLALGFVVGALVSLALLVAGRASWRTAVPFGPSMLAGTWLAVLLADHLGNLHLTW